MGAEQIQELADRLVVVRTEVNPDTATLRDPRFLEALNLLNLLLADLDTCWDSLPVEFRSVFNTRFVRKSPTEPVTQVTIARWSERPATFFDLPDDDPPSQLYRGLQARSHSQLEPVDEIRRRIYLLLFHELRERFNTRFGKHRKDVLAIYLSSRCGAEHVVRKNCADWSNRGRKYKTLAEKSGGNGALLVPTSLSRSKLEDHMRISGDNDAASEFARRVAHQVGEWNCHEAAGKIIAFNASRWEPWLDKLAWKPSQEAVGWVRREGQDRSRLRHHTKKLRTANVITKRPTASAAANDGLQLEGMSAAPSSASLSQSSPFQSHLVPPPMPRPPFADMPGVSLPDAHDLGDPSDMEVWANGSSYPSLPDARDLGGPSGMEVWAHGSSYPPVPNDHDLGGPSGMEVWAQASLYPPPLTTIPFSTKDTADVVLL